MLTLERCAVGMHLHGRSRADGSAASTMTGASGHGASDAGASALPAWGYAACSAGSAAAAALATQPLDVVKTRLQVPNYSAAARRLVPLQMPPAYLKGKQLAVKLERCIHHGPLQSGRWSLEDCQINDGRCHSAGAVCREGRQRSDSKEDEQ